MKKIIYIFILLLIGISCKKEREHQAPNITYASGVLLDTLYRRAIPNCRVFLLETKNGREQIVEETSADSLGHFQFDSLTQANTIQFANNAYAWHHPQGLTQEKYWLKPYIKVDIKIHPMPGYIVQSVQGGFNEERIDSPQIFQLLPVTTSIYDSLHIKLIRQKHLGTKSIDTLNFNSYISYTNQIIQLYE